MTQPPTTPRPVEPGDPTAGGRIPLAPRPHERRALPVVRIIAVVVALTVVVVGTVSVVSTFFVRKDRVVKPIAGTVTAVQVTQDVGDVVVRAVPPGGDVRVAASITDSFEGSHWRAELRDGTLVADGGCDDSGAWISIFDCSVDLTLEVPEGIPVTIETDTGDVRVDGAFRATVVTTATGDVTAQRVAGPLKAVTNTGSVRGDAMTARSALVETDTGDVRLGFDARPNDVSVRSDTGSVRVVVPDDATVYAVDTDTDTGDVAVEVSTAPETSNRMDLKSSTGNIRVEYS